MQSKQGFLQTIGSWMRPKGNVSRTRHRSTLRVTQLEDRLALSTISILAVGDSNTQGGDFGQSSYRYPLYEQLTADGFRIDMVGSRNFVNNEGSGNPDLSNYPNYFGSFDRDHEAYWGWDTGSVLPRVRPAAEAGNPQFVLLMLGSNDVGRGGQSAIPQAIANLETMVNDLRAVRPNVTILMAQILPFGPNNGYTPNAEWVDDFNAEVASLASRLNTESSRMVLVDQFSGFDVAEHMSEDGLHPNRVGERLIATNWYNALRPLLGNPPPRASEPVIVRNASFEEANLGNGGVTAHSGQANNWDFDTPAGTQSGYWNPDSNSYPAAEGNNSPTGGNGSTVLWLFNDVAGGPSPVVSQSLAETVRADALYQLTVSVGNRIEVDTFSVRYGGFRLELLAGSQVIASAVNTLTPAPGTFEDVTLNVDTRNLDPTLLGEPLSIRVSITDGGNRAATDFDNVRLNRVGGTLVTPTPPTSLVRNASFEAVGLQEGGVTAQSGTAFDWDFYTPANTQSGFWNTVGQAYTNASGNGAPVGGNGSTVLWLFNDQAGGPGPTVSQQLGESLFVDAVYTLTVAVGQRFANEPFGTRYGGYRIELLAGEQVIASSENTITPPPGQFQDVTLTVDTRTINPTLLGEPLTIRFGIVEGGNRAAVDYDHVRLTRDGGSPFVPPGRSVVVDNPSFEAIGLGDRGVTAHAGTAFGWDFVMPAGAQGGFWNTDVGSYLGANGEGRAQGGQGSTILWLFNDLAGETSPTASQTLAERVQADTIYRLSVAVGNRFEFDTFATRFGGYRVELLAGEVVIGSSVNEITPEPGRFRDVTVEVDTRQLDPSLLNQPLTIRLAMTEGGDRAATDFDNVRLRAVEAPTLPPDCEAPAVSRVVINQGAEQRSVVNQIRIEFNSMVGIDWDAVTLMPVDGCTPVDIYWSTQVEDGRTVLTIELGCLPGGSLADGRYTLAIRGDGVRANGQTLGGDFVMEVHRLFGDVNGDGCVDAIDRAAFDAAFGSCWEVANYRSYLDVDGDGFVWLSDQEAFEASFGRRV